MSSGEDSFSSDSYTTEDDISSGYLGEDEYTSPDDDNIPTAGDDFPTLSDIGSSLNENMPTISFKKCPSYGAATSGPSSQPLPSPLISQATFQSRFASSLLAASTSTKENNPPMSNRRRATHLNFAPGENASTPGYMSCIDPSLLLPPERIGPELCKLRAEIEQRNAIIDEQYDLYQQELQSNVTRYETQISDLQKEKAVLMKEKEDLRGEVAVLQQTLGAKLQDVEKAWMEDRNRMTNFHADLKKHLRLWIDERAQLLGKIEALEKQQETLMREKGEFDFFRIRLDCWIKRETNLRGVRVAGCDMTTALPLGGVGGYYLKYLISPGAKGPSVKVCSYILHLKWYSNFIANI
ncbi:hypothetical protein EV426DRAFT_577155 [Tirmania nivea]|nr:hypothetical protein EV426DRAFT_577155 [Tirmania nivea]